MSFNYLTHTKLINKIMNKSGCADLLKKGQHI